MRLAARLVHLGIGLGLALAGPVLLTAATPVPPDAVTPDGGRYYGPLASGKLQGQGRIEWENGARYEGGFDQGLFSGTGELAFEDGRNYRGQFVRGQFQGKGRFERPGAEVFEGDFERNEFTGYGIQIRADGARHEGRFLKWRPDGPGKFTDPNGNVYEGEFVAGEQTGTGRAIAKDGTRYEGGFRQGRFHGQGELRLANGDLYKGSFAHGLYEGKGTLTYGKPRPDGRTGDSGIWRYGKLEDAEAERRTKANVETALYRQRALLDQALAALAPRDPKRINLYLLAVGGDGAQEVFRREVEFVRAQFDREFGTRGRSVALVNSRTTVDSAPMATVTSIRESLRAIAARMDRNEDILFLFLTSHGSRTHELTLDQNGMDLRNLPAKELGALLAETNVRWKVVVVSACYSGGFIDAVKDDFTMVITAARHDRQSFGCADENDFTYFGRAFFKESLSQKKSFHEAFRHAEKLVREWEAKDLKAEGGARPEMYSLPQLYNPPAIQSHLNRWREQLAADATKGQVVRGR